MDITYARQVRSVVEQFIRGGGRTSYARTFHLMGYGLQGRGDGCVIRDISGTEFIDCFDSYGNQTFGARHPEILAAFRDELENGSLQTCKLFFNEKQLRMQAALADLTRSELPFAFFTTGGAESIDSALKLARAYTRRKKFITAQNCYHGMTLAAISTECRPLYEETYGPLLAGFQCLPFGDIAAAEAGIDGDTAAVLVEAIQCEAGVRVPSLPYFKRLRELCTERGALLIIDEIQTAFGRTGTFFAFEHFGIVPDLVCIGKSFGGGMTAISAVLSRREYWEPLRKIPRSFSSSIAGNPLALAVGLKTVEIAARAEWKSSTVRKGEVVSTALRRLAERYPSIVREVRGVGLLWGIEVFNAGVAGLICWLLNQDRIMITVSLYSPVTLRFQPPLVIDDRTLEVCLAKLETAMGQTAAFLQGVDLSRPLNVIEVELPVGRAAEAVFGRLRDSDLIQRSWSSLVTATPHGADLSCEGLFEDALVGWVDRRLVDEAGRAITYEAISGDWQTFKRVWSVADAKEANTAVLRCSIEWNVGIEEFEPLVALRLRYSMERSFRAALSAVRERCVQP